MKIYNGLLGFGFYLLAVFSLIVSFPNYAEAIKNLTVLQSRLVGLPNRFTVEVPNFKPDGMLTSKSVKVMVENELAIKRLSVVDSDEPPLAKIIINVRQNPVHDVDRDYLYYLDVNVYNLTVINTTYKLRKGTIWMFGSTEVTPGEQFPKDVERAIKRIVAYFISDYFAANPYQRKKAKK